MDAPLFRAFAPHGFPPNVVDEWEPWQAAEVLEGLLDHAEAVRQANDPKRRTSSPRRARVTGVGGVPSGDSNDLIRRRMAAARGEGPPVEAQAPAGDLSVLMTLIDTIDEDDEPVEE